MNRLLLTTVLFIVVFVFAILLSRRSENLLQKNVMITRAVVTGAFYFDRYHHHRVDYEFYIQRNSALVKAYEFHDKIALEKLKKIAGYQLLVAYDSTQPSRCKLLLTKKAYDEFNLNYPDSLKQVFQ